MIILDGISKSYDGMNALSSVDLDIDAGKTTVLIGQSGCGKSTLLRTIIGLVRPDSGVVRIDGEKLGPDNVIPVRRKMGYVIQEGGLFPHLTIRENVTLMPLYLGWRKDAAESRIEELASLTKFPEEALARYPGEVSGGQRQRVSLMRALALDPEILLLDEPLGALDPLIRSELQDDLRDIFRRLGKTVVFVTHDIGEAAYLGDSIVFLNDGRVLQKGGIRDLLERPADPFIKRFITAQRSPIEPT